jgi:hypothetical protein
MKALVICVLFFACLVVSSYQVPVEYDSGAAGLVQVYNNGAYLAHFSITFTINGVVRGHATGLSLTTFLSKLKFIKVLLD